MKTASEIVSVLNNLIETNLDRISGYEKAAANIQDKEVKELCNSLASQSRAFKSQLEQLVSEYNGQLKDGSYARSVVYRTANGEIKHPVSNSKKSVLISCETEEDAALQNYRHAKIDSLGFPARVVTIILNQNSEIVKALEKIRFFQNVMH